MNFHGIVHKFPVNCSLSDWEARRKVHQDKAESATPWGCLSVIKMNSTYLETVDKFFEYRGTITAVCLPGVVMFSSAMFIFPSIALNSWAENSLDDQKAELYFLAFVLTLAIGMVLFLANTLRKELFRYTHYPIRFNRKNRMVYVTRLNGTVMVESWDKLVFTRSQCGDETVQEIRGHRMAEDGVTVLETFGLPGSADMPYIFCIWEFVRRYMEHGPEELMDKVALVADVEYRRESVFHSFLRVKSTMNAIWVIALPIILWITIGRIIANFSARRPRWPKEIEAECQIEADDPYIIDIDNPPEETDWSWLGRGGRQRWG